MPKTKTDYSKTIIYKIVCKDLNIKDCYVGHTTNWIKRKSQHKTTCNNKNHKNSNLNVYKFIRENGGWDNWEMIEIKKYPCNDKQQARSEERRLYEELNANLNTRKPLRTEDEKKDYDKEQKQKNKIKRYEKASQKIQCECGTMIRKGDISAHRKTKKHQELLKKLNKEIKEKIKIIE